jgi:hypothetical protein
VIGTFGSDEVHRFLHDTGFGSHPAVVRFLSRIGKAMSEGSFVMPNASTEGEESRADAFYRKANKGTPHKPE